MSGAKDTDDAVTDALVREVIIKGWLPTCTERRRGSTRIWLPSDLDPVSPYHMIDVVWRKLEAATFTLGDCIMMVGAALRAIEEGVDPSDAAFPLPALTARVRERDGRAWLDCRVWAAEVDRIEDETLLIYAMDEEQGWALTLHGLHRFQEGSAAGPSEDETVEAELEPLRAGGTP